MSIEWEADTMAPHRGFWCGQKMSIEWEVDTMALHIGLDEVSKDNLMQHLEWFSKVRRDTGGPGENAAADYISDKLASYGVECIVHEYESYLSYPIHAKLEVLEPEYMCFQALTHSFGKSTGPHGVTAQLKYLTDQTVRYGTGRAVMIDGLQDPIPTVDAYEAGVSALIFVNADWYIHNMIATPVWGTPSYSQLGQIPDIPCISINHESGEKLKDLLKEGPVTVRVTAEVKTGWVHCKLPEAIIRGTEEPEKFVLAAGHMCAWEVGITDNATGDACLLEMARLLNLHRAELKRSVRIAWWPGHSHGRYAGSCWYSDHYWEELSDNCLMYYNIDSPGAKNATQYRVKHTSAECERFGQDMITKVTGQVNSPKHRPSKCADQSFLMIGVPSCSCYSFIPDNHPDRKMWTGGSAGGWWWHTEFDTQDKADVDILAKDTELSCAIATELTNCDILPFHYGDVAREAETIIGKIAETAGAYVDFSSLLKKVSDFRAAADKLEKAQTGGSDPHLINELIMETGRLIVPVIYNSSGRFVHDQAEVSPLRRFTSSMLYPVLSAAAGLPELAGQNEFGFLKAEVIREINRAGDAFTRATKLINRALR